jgi:uncharacterized protein HemX
MASIEVQEVDNDQTEQQVVDTPQEIAPVEQPTTNTISKKKSSKLRIGLLLLIVIGLIVAGLILINDRNKLKEEVNKLSSQSQIAASDEATQLNSEAHRLVELSTDEVPSIATVADAGKLKQQFKGFETTQNGDKLLIYTQSKQIIVYRPSSKKIVSIVQITLGQGAPTTGTVQKNQ